MNTSTLKKHASKHGFELIKFVLALCAAIIGFYYTFLQMQRDVKENKEGIQRNEERLLPVNKRSWENHGNIKDLQKDNEHNKETTEKAYKRIERHMEEQKAWNTKMDTRQQQMQIDVKVIQKELETRNP